VISNHETCGDWLSGTVSIPQSANVWGKAAQEAQFREVVAESGAELTVLARYMQVLSEEMCRQLQGRCINIHHSFLLASKEPSPITRPHERGVKVVGATAHYVTSELDEGPIIEQETQRVTHALDADAFRSDRKGYRKRGARQGSSMARRTSGDAQRLTHSRLCIASERLSMRGRCSARDHLRARGAHALSQRQLAVRRTAYRQTSSTAGARQDR